MQVFIFIVLHYFIILGPAMVIGYFAYTPFSHWIFPVVGILLWVIGYGLLNLIKSRLHVAAFHGRVEQIKELLDLRELGLYNINEKRSAGRTPLHWAAHNGHLYATEVLLEQGADINIQDNFGNTPIQYARQFGHDEIADLLDAQ